MAGPIASPIPTAMSSKSIATPAKYQPPDAEKPALKNIAQRYHGRGVAPAPARPFQPARDRCRRDPRFHARALGSRVTEQIQLDNGRIGGCWFTVNNKSYDMA